MILRLALGIALGIKIAQDSLFGWHTIEMLAVAVIWQMLDNWWNH